MREELKMDALNLEQLEKVSGGDHGMLPCKHTHVKDLGQSKYENGEQLFYVQCKNCGKTMWVKPADLIAPATEV